MGRQVDYPGSVEQEGRPAASQVGAFMLGAALGRIVEAPQHRLPQVRVTDMWDAEDDRVVLAFGRSMG